MLPNVFAFKYTSTLRKHRKVVVCQGNTRKTDEKHGKVTTKPKKGEEE